MRFVIPCVYSCMTMSFESAPSRCGLVYVHRYTRIWPDWPSADDAKFALFVPPPSWTEIWTRSAPAPPFPRFVFRKLNVFSVKPYRYVMSCSYALAVSNGRGMHGKGKGSTVLAM